MSESGEQSVEIVMIEDDAGHARLIGGELEIRGLVLRPDGSESLEAVRRGSPGDAVALGREAGSELRSRMPPDFLKA